MENTANSWSTNWKKGKNFPSLTLKFRKFFFLQKNPTWSASKTIDLFGVLEKTYLIDLSFQIFFTRYNIGAIISYGNSDILGYHNGHTWIRSARINTDYGTFNTFWPTSKGSHLNWSYLSCSKGIQSTYLKYKEVPLQIFDADEGYGNVTCEETRNFTFN